MTTIDINYFYSKKNVEVQLDNEIINLLNTLFNNKSVDKPQNSSILKNQKIQTHKKLLVNKTNLILNKLSEKNMENLIEEFIKNIKNVTHEEFKEIQETFYIKIILDIKFLKNYFNFLIYIAYIYNKVYNYNLNYFINIIQTKFMLDYDNNYEISDKYIFLEDFKNEEKRINNLILLNYLLENQYFKNELLNNCNKIIINQKKYYYDIYYWIKINKLININILDIINDNNNIISNREKILLYSLIENEKIELEEINDEKIEEYNLIINDYLVTKSLEDICNYIKQNKNSFLEILIENYFIYNSIKSREIYNLFVKLLENNIYTKNDFLEIYNVIINNWEDKNIDYNNGDNKKNKLYTLIK